MIEMWDELFSSLNPEIGRSLRNSKGKFAFELMHGSLNLIWEEIDRVVMNGGIICINIGDATRKIGYDFELYPNHMKIARFFSDKGYSFLPGIIWRKQSNKPNKFMGSGMLPPSAYITMEHEYILILRKGSKRNFTPDEKKIRNKSAFFWEERNIWFSDIWHDLKGVSQELYDTGTRKRSAAFPFELPYRLIHMFSIMGDNVLDPFLGTGTTSLAAMCGGRNSFGYEIDSRLCDKIRTQFQNVKQFQHALIHERLRKHTGYIHERVSQGKECKYFSENYGFPVITNQETEIIFPLINYVTNMSDSLNTAIFQCNYELFHGDVKAEEKKQKKTDVILSFDHFL
jgi:DNA modification methylase